MKILINLSSTILTEALRRLLAECRETWEILVAGSTSDTDGGLCPDKIIVDGCSLKQDIYTTWPDAKVILIDTGQSEETIISLLISYRIDGVISCATDLTLFKKAIEAIDSGQVWLENGKIKALLQSATMSRNSQQNRISRKEQEIIQLISQGHRNREIANQLCISEQTVKAHISRIFKKVNVTSRSQLVPLAIAGKLSNQG